MFEGFSITTDNNCFIGRIIYTFVIEPRYLVNYFGGSSNVFGSIDLSSYSMKSSLIDAQLNRSWHESSYLSGFSYQPLTVFIPRVCFQCINTTQEQECHEKKIHKTFS
uniref:Uncharacterized protein n=1 Tax=Cacopsylla melanoneura TaxID=428564 RepID=A0A8D8SYU3_9HEMI